MSKLASLELTFINAAHYLGKPGSRRWRVFDAIDGKSTSPEIAKRLDILPNNCAKDSTGLFEKGLVELVEKAGNAAIYRKIPELRNVNLAPYSNRKRFTSKPEAAPTPTPPAPTRIAQSRNIEAILTLGSKYGVANIDQDWTDAMVILNFIETLLTKFLMDHGYTETQIEKLHWDEKAKKVENKLYEEATKKGTKPRRIVISNLANYRTNRNTLDHEAHIPDGKVESHEVALLLKLVQALAKEIFDEHKRYCALA